MLLASLTAVLPVAQTEARPVESPLPDDESEIAPPDSLIVEVPGEHSASSTARLSLDWEQAVSLPELAGIAHGASIAILIMPEDGGAPVLVPVNLAAPSAGDIE